MSDEEQQRVDEDQPPANPVTDAATPSPEPMSGLPNRRARHFRAKLLEKLPRLGFQSTAGITTLDVRQDLAGIGELDADAFLSPLESLQRGGPE
jgi:hypothetical protein